VKAQFGSASILQDGRVVFDIGGNKYRIVVWINYPYRVVYIGFIGTHQRTTPSTPSTFEHTMNIKPIKTKADYRATLKEVESLMMAKADTPEGDKLDILVTLVEAYERAHFPMDLPDAVEAIKFRMEQSGLTVEDLEPVIGRKNRVYEVLSCKRPLSLRMIEGLHTRFDIAAESLLRQGTGKDS
jgi:HTH-type transcriptional regulator / antitoxin HigA